MRIATTDYVKSITGSNNGLNLIVEDIEFGVIYGGFGGHEDDTMLLTSNVPIKSVLSIEVVVPGYNEDEWFNPYRGEGYERWTQGYTLRNKRTELWHNTLLAKKESQNYDVTGTARITYLT